MATPAINTFVPSILFLNWTNVVFQYCKDDTLNMFWSKRYMTFLDFNKLQWLHNDFGNLFSRTVSIHQRYNGTYKYVVNSGWRSMFECLTLWYFGEIQSSWSFDRKQWIPLSNGKSSFILFHINFHNILQHIVISQGILLLNINTL